MLADLGTRERAQILKFPEYSALNLEGASLGFQTILRAK
jgi:hypothetical protein